MRETIDNLLETSRNVTSPAKIVIRLSSFVILLSVSGCLSQKNVPANGLILTAQTIRGNRTIPTDELESLIPQRPNRRILGLPVMPSLWFYRLGERRFDREAAVRALAAKTTEFEQRSQQIGDQSPELRKLNRRFERQAKRLRLKIEEGNWMMRNLGEPPAYYAEADVQANAGKMRKYLESKGFFKAQTSYSVDSLRGRRQARVTYVIDEREPFFLRTITYEIGDARIDTLVRQSLDRSALNAGDRYDGDRIAAEKVRIESLLRDQGYYTFSRQYIPNPDIDSTRRFPGDSLHRNLDLYLQIRNPPGRSAHPVYRIGEVEVRISSGRSDASVDAPGRSDVSVDAPGVDAPGETQPAGAAIGTDTVSRNGITYLLGGRNISLRLLDNKIFLRPGALYSQTQYRDTQRQLFLLNQFKFVNVNFTDTTNRRIRTLVTATPIDKYEYTFEGGLFVLYQGQGYPGPFTNLTFRARNLFGGLETFETSVRFGFEAQTGFNTASSSGPDVYTARELGVTTSLIFPQILFPGRLRFRFNPYNPRTQVSVGFTSTTRPDFQRSLLRATMAYNWSTTPAKQFSFLIADVNLINAGPGFRSDISQQFRNQVELNRLQGGTLYLSFRRSFASGISFAYTYNTNVPGQNQRANFFRTVVESGGTTLNFFPTSQLRRVFSLTDSTGLQYYKYLRLSVDFRHYVPLRPRTTLAFRVNAGLVYGYGPGRTAPYEKLFFAGGSNSIRAWLPRRLGPGAELPQSISADQRVPAFDTLRKGRGEQFRYLFEKPGDVLIEGSAELRGHLFHLLTDIDGALFIDVGNVWTLRNNVNRYGEQFNFNTLVPQIAVGTGAGLRLDFSFFIVRFDGGIKVWDPARQYRTADGPEGRWVDERFLLPKFSLRRLSKGPNPLVVNFGIGYPF